MEHPKLGKTPQNQAPDGNCALAHGAPHRDSRHELEPLTDAHAKRVPKPTLTKHVVGFSC